MESWTDAYSYRATPHSKFLLFPPQSLHLTCSCCSKCLLQQTHRGAFTKRGISLQSLQINTSLPANTVSQTGQCLGKKKSFIASEYLSFAERNLYSFSFVQLLLTVLSSVATFLPKLIFTHLFDSVLEIRISFLFITSCNHLSHGFLTAEDYNTF